MGGESGAAYRPRYAAGSRKIMIADNDGRGDSRYWPTRSDGPFSDEQEAERARLGGTSRSIVGDFLA